jgi:hypothetical protein
MILLGSALPAVLRVSMRRAIIGFGVAAMLIGCGGSSLTTRETSTSGTSGTTSGSTTSGSTTSGSFAVIPSTDPGRLNINLLTGLGRAATVSVDINQVSFARLAGGPLTNTFNPVRVGLDGYTHNLISTSTGLSPASQDFAQMSFRISKLILPGGQEINGAVTTSAALKARTGPGRIVSLRLLLDDSMVFEDNGAIDVDELMFAAANQDPFGGVLPCFYSDLVRIDISGVAQRPTLSVGGPAKYLYLSGDLLALSNDTPSSFEAFFGINRSLDTVAQRAGSFVTAGSSGSYQLNETDPNDPNNVIKRLEGTWTDAGNVVENIGSFAMIVFPSCDTDNMDQVLMISLGSGGVEECYFGELNTADAMFVAYPVSDLGSQTPSLIGGSVVNSSLGGTFTIQFGSKPSSFPASGSYVRFVR